MHRHKGSQSGTVERNSQDKSALPGTPTHRTKHAHSVLHLLRNPIVAHHRSGVTQAAAFPLDDEAPQRIAGIRNQRSPHLGRGLPIAVVLAEGCERSLERAARVPKRRSLLLRYFIIERVCDRCRRAAEWDHLPTDIIVTPPIVTAQTALPASVATLRPKLRRRGRGRGAVRL